VAKVRILVVDDDKTILDLCADLLQGLPNTEVILESQSRQAAERLAEERFDLLITDIRMPEVDGLELMRLAHQHDPQLLLLMITAFPSVETAVESMKYGASDYLTKPFHPLELQRTVQQLLDGRRLHQEHSLLQRQVERTYLFDEIVGKSPAMQNVFNTIQQLAEIDIDVLISGETGTGKELVARSLHTRSPRSEARFVPIDCGAIPEDLLENELFGHERGAFTGAHTQSLGLVEFADQGTFFFDEIGSLSLTLQAKLLRALQERRFRRVGGKEELAMNVRVVAASNRDLFEEVNAQRFRADLYYRLNVGRIELPPLRHRDEDISLLATHFVERFAHELKKPSVDVLPEVLEVFNAYVWPGNVRELQNVIKRAMAMSRNTVLSLDDLPDYIVSQAGDRSFTERAGFFYMRTQHVATFEKAYFTDLLRACKGDVMQAIEEARMPRGTFYRLLKKHNLVADEFRPPC
jgi:DNA-binding NtrC family response regulator